MTGTTRLTLWRQALPSKKFLFNAKTIFFCFFGFFLFYVLIIKCAEQVQVLRRIPEELPVVKELKRVGVDSAPRLVETWGKNSNLIHPHMNPKRGAAVLGC